MSIETHVRLIGFQCPEDQETYLEMIERAWSEHCEMLEQRAKQAENDSGLWQESHKRAWITISRLRGTTRKMAIYSLAVTLIAVGEALWMVAR